MDELVSTLAGPTSPVKDKDPQAVITNAIKATPKNLPTILIGIIFPLSISLFLNSNKAFFGLGSYAITAQ